MPGRRLIRATRLKPAANPLQRRCRKGGNVLAQIPAGNPGQVVQGLFRTSTMAASARLFGAKTRKRPGPKSGLSTSQATSTTTSTKRGSTPEMSSLASSSNPRG